MAETVGFEPTVPVKVQLISSQSRYDHFDTSPYSRSLFASSPILSKPPGFVNSRAAILRFPLISPLIVEKPVYFMKIDQ